MRKFWIPQAALAALILISMPLRSAYARQASAESQCCSAVIRALDAVGHIKEGITRADVEKEFTQDGGLFSRGETIYTFKLCPYIKVKVKYTLDADYPGFADGSPRDVVQSTSKPYIEYSTGD